MERVCFTFQLKPGTEDEYKKRHDEIWPELVDAVKESGFTNYTLFRRDLQVIGYAECVPDVATVFGKIGSYDVNTRWSKWFEDLIEQLTDEHGQMFYAPEVWHLD